MSAIEKEIHSLIFTQLDATQRYRLALVILQEYLPEVDSGELSISDSAKLEYRKRREAYEKGDMAKRPWREVMDEFQAKYSGK